MNLKEWRNDYDDGYYAVMIGHAEGASLLEHPASFCRISLGDYEFLTHWHDLDSNKNRKYEKFGMALLGKKPVIQFLSIWFMRRLGGIFNNLLRLQVRSRRLDQDDLRNK